MSIANNKKSVHTRMSKTLHNQLRRRLFDEDLSLQQFFNGFAELVVSEYGTALNCLKQIRIRCSEKELKKEKTSFVKADIIDSVDVDKIYDLIEENK